MECTCLNPRRHKLYSRHHRKARILFGVSDVALTALAFEAAYLTRVYLPLEKEFELTVPIKALLLGFATLIWVLFGYWLGVYERLDSSRLVAIVRDATRQCGIGGIACVLFEYSLNLDLSRGFLALFIAYSWLLLLLFRWRAGKVVGIIRREFAAPHHVIVVGIGERALRLGRMLEASGDYGIRLLGFLTDEPDRPEHVQLSTGYRVYSLDRLNLLLQENVIDEILFAVDSARLAALEDVFLLATKKAFAPALPSISSPTSTAKSISTGTAKPRCSPSLPPLTTKCASSSSASSISSSPPRPSSFSPP